jgi:serine phosphatase RsbU (regulator of sigma subunit)
MAVQTPGPVQRLRSFLTEYTAGVGRRDLARLFKRDAARAYAVLTREHQGEEPKEGFKRFLHRAKLAFLGLSYKLSPARRVLFAASLLAFFLGLINPSIDVEGNEVNVSIGQSAFWFTVSVAGLVYLLALELVDRVRVRDELEVARELQAELLPGHVPDVPGYLFAHSYRTANEVGGDYYDVIPVSGGPGGRLALVVADASGHGMAAGLVMAIANATLKTALDLDPAPERVLELMNRTLCRTGSRRTFLSLFYGLLDPATGELSYICAGHPFPLLRRLDGAVVELGRGGLPLGLKEPLAVETQSVRIAPGETLLLYTDGLVEAVDGEARAFGYDRLSAILRMGGQPQALHQEILATFDRHVGDEPLRDDLTLLVMTRLPPLPV